VSVVGIADLLVAAAAGHTGRVALTLGGRPVGFDELAGICAAGGARLAGAGAGHVVFVGVGSASFPVSMFSAAYAGITYTPLNYRLAADQIAALVRRLDRPVVLADPQYLADPAFSAEVGAAALALLDASSFVDSCAAAPMDAGPAAVDPDSPAVVLFTSGTTATPKGVLLSHANLDVSGSPIPFGFAAPTDASLVAVPPYHVIGVTAVLGSLHAGRRQIFLGAFSPAAWLAAAKADHATSATLVPTMLARLTHHLDGRVADVPTLRIIAYGGSKMPRPVLERALHSFPQVDFLQSYGLTETNGGITALRPEDHRVALASDDPAVAARLGSVGPTLPGIELQVRAADGTALTAGEVGELWVRGRRVSRAYLGTGSALDPDGWFPTRDFGYVDRDGFVFIEGRTDDVIIRGGENIAPAEIEDVLVEHPAIEEVVVVGVPDEEWGERITAVIVLADGASADAEELRAFVRARLRGSRTPDDVVFRTELPYTDTGKVKRRVLVRELSVA
jgi:acyl-CoA synthetase (AMP-forming)/AMP-acid ligase II